MFTFLGVYCQNSSLANAHSAPGPGEAAVNEINARLWRTWHLARERDTSTMRATAGSRCRAGRKLGCSGDWRQHWWTCPGTGPWMALSETVLMPTVTGEGVGTAGGERLRTTQGLLGTCEGRAMGPGAGAGGQILLVVQGWTLLWGIPSGPHLGKPWHQSRAEPGPSARPEGGAGARGCGDNSETGMQRPEVSGALTGTTS